NGRFVPDHCDAGTFQPIDGVAELLHCLPLQREARQVHDRVVADLELLETQTLVDGTEIRQRLVEGKAPIVFYTEFPELTDDGFNLVFRADGIGQDNREVRPYSIG